MWARSTRVALLACGSFNPPTFMHLRMMELAKEAVETQFKCQVVEGIISPVADSYSKPNLVCAEHRLNMLQLATGTSDWILPDGWEARRNTWSRTANVLEYHQNRIKEKYGEDVKLILVVGADVVQSFETKISSDTWLWQKEDLIRIVNQHGIICLVREGTRPRKVIEGIRFLANFTDFIMEVEDEVCPNAISSTRIRDAVKEGKSLKYVVDDTVVAYIKKHRLYIPSHST